VALVIWSLLVWTTRIRNIWSDDELSTADQWWRTALAMSFTLLALVVGVALYLRSTWQRPVVLALAVWTIGVWVVRSIGIATAEHDGAFVAVHLVLATVSIGLAVLAARELRAQVKPRAA